MRTKIHNMRTDITQNKSHKVTNNDLILNPLVHLKHNYLNPKSAVAFTGITNIYNFYGGKLSYKDIKNFLKTIDSYTLHKRSKTFNIILLM